MTLVAGVGIVAAAFFVGAIPFGLVVSTVAFKRDLRREGSGNIGAANALRSMGKGPAVAVLLLDALKGAAAVAAGRAAGGDALAAVAGLAAVCGHCFSPFLGFRGGKGVATHLGAAVAFAWPSAAAFAAVWLAIVAATGFSSAGSLVATLLMVPTLWALAGPAAGTYGLAAAALIVAMHRGNIARLRDGTESRLPLFRKVKGEPPG